MGDDGTVDENDVFRILYLILSMPPALSYGANRTLIQLVRHCCYKPSNQATKRKMSDFKMPSTMTGPPVCALVPPGMCQFGEDLVKVPLIERTRVSPTSSVLRFGLPDREKPLNLSTCACILANAEIKGEDITRPYTPISTNDMAGCFDLLIKDYGPEAHMSHHMHTIQPGDEIAFKHIKFNVKTQAPFPYDHILMLVGGTGITPMIQALHAILGSKDGKKPKVTMLYGSKFQNDILGMELRHKWAEDYPDQFTLVDILSDEPEDSGWTGERGYISKEMIEMYFPGPEVDNTQIFVCGPPPLYAALSGPRDDKDKVSGILGEMGYKPEQVYKF